LKNGKLIKKIHQQKYDDIHTIENQPSVKNNFHPLNNSSINDYSLTIQAQASANLRIKQVDFFMNDQLIGTDRTSPYSITFNPSYLFCFPNKTNY